MRLTLRLNLLVSLVLLAAALALAWTHILPLPPLLVLLIPPMVFFCGTTRVYTFVLNRHSRFRPIAAAEVATSLTGIFFKILAGLLNGLSQILHTIGLPLGTILGKVAGNIYYRSALRRSGLDIYRPSAASAPEAPAAPAARQLAAKYRNFPLYAAPRELVSSFSASLPFLFLSAIYDQALLGLFGLALTFTMRPVNILANTFEKVLYPDASQRVIQDRPIGRDIRRLLLAIAAVSLPLAVVAFLFAEPVFVFLFGAKWIGTGYYLRCILPWVVVLLMANSLCFVANVFSTQRADFIIQVVQLLLRVAALWVGSRLGQFPLAILLYCAVSCAMQLIQLAWYLFQIRRHDRRAAARP